MGERRAQQRLAGVDVPFPGLDQTVGVEREQGALGQFQLDGLEGQPAEVARVYGPSELRPGEQRWGSDKIKVKLAEVLASIAENHQRARKAVTEEMMAEVFRVRRIS